MGERWTPTLRLDETGSGCRLTLVGLAHGNGDTLQEASDDLIGRILKLVLAVRSSGFRAPGELAPPELRLLDFIWELGELATRGDDIRERVFGLRSYA
jgi:hypothetical protein